VADKNIIRKQSVHFRYNGHADGFALQKEVSDWCTFVLLPEIEEQLEPFALSGEYISIDRLEIDARIDKNDWQQQIRTELISALNKKLLHYKPALKTAAEKAGTVAKKLDELMIFYFEHGYLPWWGKALITTDLRTVLQYWVMEPMPASRAEEIMQRLQQIITDPVLERIMNQVGEQYFFQFVKNIFRKETEFIGETERFCKEILTAEIPVVQKAAIIKGIHSFLLRMMIRNAGKPDAVLLAQFIRKELSINHVSSVKVASATAQTITAKGSLAKAWQDLQAVEKKTAVSKQQDPVKNEQELRYNKIIDRLSLQSKAENKREEMIASQQEGIYIENAGAVIFAAYIPTLFEKLNITRDQRIVDTDLAAMLIQYAVTNNPDVEEHELVLPKILCGIDLELPVNTNVQIKAEQTKEVEDMLSAVIANWAAIKDTSIPGLRASFLQRSGKISLVNNEWLLQVEQRPYDMLLQQLPWSMSMIRLTWMTKLLKTEWV